MHSYSSGWRSMPTRNRQPHENAVRWIPVALAILTAYTAGTLGVLGSGDLVAKVRNPSPVDMAR